MQLLEFVSTIRLEHFGVVAELPPIEDYARKLPFSYLAEEAPDLARYVERAYPDPNSMVSGWMRQFLDAGRRRDRHLRVLVRMCQGIQSQLTYAMRFEVGTQPPAVTLESGARYLPRLRALDDGRRADARPRRALHHRLPLRRRARQAEGENVSTAYPHAWMEAYLPAPAGWSSIRPTASSDRIG